MQCGNLLCVLALATAATAALSTAGANLNSTSSSNGSPNVIKAFRKVYAQCETSTDMLRCLKVQALRLVDRALRLPNIELVAGVTVTRKDEHERGDGVTRAFAGTEESASDLAKLTPTKIDEILAGRANQFLNGHELEISMPRLLAYGQQETGRLVEEGRKKMKKYLGAFLGALAIKAGILTMAYHSIAIVAGKALIIGKIALIISAIIGLKKLVTPEGHEKTTYEIVKHPHVSQSHSYSSSHGEYEGHEGGGGGGSSGQYHRSLRSVNVKLHPYRGHAPSTA